MIEKLQDPKYLKIIIWTLITPDERNAIIGYRWSAENKSYSIYSDFYTSEGRAMAGLKYAAFKFGFAYKKVKTEIRTNTEFLA